MSIMPSSPGSNPWEQVSNSLTIGTVTFLDEEHPDEIDFPLDQALSVQQLVGGARTVQALGPNPKDITWSGHLFGSNVSDRLSQLKAMQTTAQPVSLAWFDQSYQVVIRSLSSKYSHNLLAMYEITVCVLADTSGQYNQNAPPTSGQQVNGLSQAAQAEVNALVAGDSVGTQALVLSFNALFAAIEIAGAIL